MIRRLAPRLVHSRIALSIRSRRPFIGPRAKASRSVTPSDNLEDHSRTKGHLVKEIRRQRLPETEGDVDDIVSGKAHDPSLHIDAPESRIRATRAWLEVRNRVESQVPVSHPLDRPGRGNGMTLASTNQLYQTLERRIAMKVRDLCARSVRTCGRLQPGRCRMGDVGGRLRHPADRGRREPGSRGHHGSGHLWPVVTKALPTSQIAAGT